MQFKQMMDLRNRFNWKEPYTGVCADWAWSQVSSEQKNKEHSQLLVWVCPPYQDRASELTLMLDHVGKTLKEAGLNIEYAQWENWLTFIDLPSESFNPTVVQDYQLRTEDILQDMKARSAGMNAESALNKVGIYPVMDTMSHFVQFNPETINGGSDDEMQQAFQEFLKTKGMNTSTDKGVWSVKQESLKAGPVAGVDYVLLQKPSQKGKKKRSDAQVPVSPNPGVQSMGEMCTEVFQRLERDQEKETPYGKNALFFMPTVPLMAALILIGYQQQHKVSLHEAWTALAQKEARMLPVPSLEMCESFTVLTPEGWRRSFPLGLMSLDFLHETPITAGGLRSGVSQWMLEHVHESIRGIERWTRWREEVHSEEDQATCNESWDHWKKEHHRMAVDHLNTLGLRTGVLKQLGWFSALLEENLQDALGQMNQKEQGISLWYHGQCLLGRIEPSGEIKPLGELKQDLLAHLFLQYKEEWNAYRQREEAEARKEVGARQYHRQSTVNAKKQPVSSMQSWAQNVEWRRELSQPWEDEWFRQGCPSPEQRMRPECENVPQKPTKRL